MIMGCLLMLAIKKHQIIKEIKLDIFVLLSPVDC